jgi:hypothetical protein
MLAILAKIVLLLDALQLLMLFIGTLTYLEVKVFLLFILVVRLNIKILIYPVLIWGAGIAQSV